MKTVLTLASMVSLAFLASCKPTEDYQDAPGVHHPPPNTQNPPKNETYPPEPQKPPRAG